MDERNKDKMLLLVRPRPSIPTIKRWHNNKVEEELKRYSPPLLPLKEWQLCPFVRRGHTRRIATKAWKKAWGRPTVEEAIVYDNSVAVSRSPPRVYASRRPRGRR